MVGFIATCIIMVLFVISMAFSIAFDCTLKQKIMMILFTLITYALIIFGVYSLIVYIVNQ